MRKIHLEKESACPSLGRSVLPTSNHVPSVPEAAHAFVIVIDDSVTVRKVVATCLGREGYAVRDFQDGVEAMRWLITPGSHVPHLVILDVGLPKMDGYEVARHLKSKPRFQNTVIIMLTGRDGIIDRLKGRLAGAQTYLTKPITTQALISTVKTHLGIPGHPKTGMRSAQMQEYAFQRANLQDVTWRRRGQ